MRGRSRLEIGGAGDEEINRGTNGLRPTAKRQQREHESNSNGRNHGMRASTQSPTFQLRPSVGLRGIQAPSLEARSRTVVAHRLHVSREVSGANSRRMSNRQLRPIRRPKTNQLPCPSPGSAYQCRVNTRIDSLSKRAVHLPVTRIVYTAG
jgi:hypothetical protein